MATEVDIKTSQAVNKLAQARDASRKDNFNKAESLTKEAINISRNIDSQDLLNKARSLLADIRNKEKKEQKISDYHTAIAKARSELNKGNFDKAKTLAQRAVALAPNTTTKNTAKDFLAKIKEKESKSQSKSVPKPTPEPMPVPTPQPTPKLTPELLESPIPRNKIEKPDEKPGKEKDITTDITQLFKNYWMYLAAGGAGLFLFMNSKNKE